MNRVIFIILQSPRNGEDLSDGEAEIEAGSHEEQVPRESSPEDGLGGGGQVRVKVTKLAIRIFWWLSLVIIQW